MGRQFQSATLSEFQDLIEAYPFTRTITDVHLHHTWKPRQADYRGRATIESMWRHHTTHNGWEDIAQHVTIAPDGAIWLCRNFNWAPASARGFNGNRTAGPFMIELIGDFDRGMDALPGEQMTAALCVIKTVQTRFDLPATALRFHRDMSSKSCPGSSNDKSDWIERINRYVPVSSRSPGEQPFSPRARRYRELLEAMNPEARQQREPLDAEHDCGDDPTDRSASPPSQSRGLDDDALDRLADHVVNLERGRLSTSGRIETSKADIDRLFEELLVSKIDTARAAGRKFQLLFYAHGGLVSEKNALTGALAQLDFWLDNDVYPIFFVWETSLAETIKQLVRDAFGRLPGRRDGLPRGAFTDPLVEELSRALGGDTVWAGMQSSARLASESDGGAAYVAKKTGQLIKRFSSDVQVHTVGHSAGCIFQAHFMTELAARKVKVRSAHFLAPAIRNDLFHATVTPLLGKKIRHLTLFTMNKRREKRDTVAGIYRQSLLYLVHEAFERKRKTPILGLEESLRDDAKARVLFGLRGNSSDTAEIVFSPSDDTGGGSASNSKTHGGFDEDRTTMESVLRRVLNKRRGETIEPFPSGLNRSVTGFWDDQFEWPAALAELEHATPGTVPSISDATRPPAAGGSIAVAPARPAVDSHPGNANGSSARVTALCVGINQYRESPLAGCVADAHLWANTLRSLGFEPEVMTDAEATGDAIRQRLTQLVCNSTPGDHLVFQFAGHGTQFEDESGDESDDSGPALDECLCAFDCESADSGLVIDDEIRAILDRLPNGVSMTCFFDCCHSGSATRMLQRLSAHGAARTDTRARFLKPTPAMHAAYERRLDDLRHRSARGAAQRREVLFSACRDVEKAYETNGQGDFTRAAVALLSTSVGRLTNVQFLERVLESFGSQARQTPQIDCEFTGRSRQLLTGESIGPGDDTAAHSPGNGVWSAPDTTPERVDP